MIQHPLERKRVVEARNRMVIEVMLHLWALLTTLVVIRTIVMLLGVSDRVWIGRVVLGSTRIITEFTENLPGFGYPLVGPFGMIDLILMAIVILGPLWLMSFVPRT